MLGQERKQSSLISSLEDNVYLRIKFRYVNYVSTSSCPKQTTKKKKRKEKNPSDCLEVKKVTVEHLV